MRSFDAAAIILGCLAASAQIMALSIPAHDISTEFSPLVENVHHNLYKRSSGRAAAARAMKELEGGTFLSESQERQKIKSAKLKEEKEMIALAREEAKRKNAEQDRLRVERERVERERQLGEEQGKRNLRTEAEIAEEIAEEVKKKGDQVTKREKEKESHRLKTDIAADKVAKSEQGQREVDAKAQAEQRKIELAARREAIVQAKLVNDQAQAQALIQKEEAMSIQKNHSLESHEQLHKTKDKAMQIGTRWSALTTEWDSALAVIEDNLNNEVMKLIHPVLANEHPGYNESDGGWERVRMTEQKDKISGRMVVRSHIVIKYKGVTVMGKSNDLLIEPVIALTNEAMASWEINSEVMRQEFKELPKKEGEAGQKHNSLVRVTDATSKLHAQRVHQCEHHLYDLRAERERLDVQELELTSAAESD